jgi:hypothetical protein
MALAHSALGGLLIAIGPLMFITNPFADILGKTILLFVLMGAVCAFGIGTTICVLARALFGKP